ncbi:MAG TPA: hypothetical protein PLD62_10055 [Candidatus Cloacimonadota bacterium]|nr:hypothetical protein [Candidatus Cloacimonadota bacterium]
MKKIIVLMFVFVSTFLFSQTEIMPTRNIAVLPITSLGIDNITLQVTQSVLEKEIAKQPSLRLFPVGTVKQILQNRNCSNESAAVDFGKEIGVDLVLITAMNKLGNKLLVQFILVDVAQGTTVLADDLTATGIEDLDMVMKRLAVCVDKGLGFQETAEIGLITNYEENEPRRRMARSYGGGSYGFFFPMKGFRNDTDRSFLFDLRTGYEMDRHEVGLLIGLRKGFVSNIYYSYLLSGKDVCPFIGGSAGFHWLTYQGSTLDSANGLELGLRTGFQLFRTYDFHILINFEYSLILTEEYHQAMVISLGLLNDFRKK